MFKIVISAAYITTLLMFVATTTAIASESAITDEIDRNIRSVLAEQGYTVGKIKIEDGLFEAYARKNGKKYEVYLNNALNVVRTQED
jgi:hypothetical protein